MGDQRMTHEVSPISSDCWQTPEQIDALRGAYCAWSVTEIRVLESGSVERLGVEV